MFYDLCVPLSSTNVDLRREVKRKAAAQHERQNSQAQTQVRGQLVPSATSSPSSGGGGAGETPKSRRERLKRERKEKLANARSTFAEERREFIKHAIELGYDGIAFMHTINGRVTAEDMCNFEPIDTKTIAKNAGRRFGGLRMRDAVSERGFRQLSRCHVNLASNDQAHCLASTKSNAMIDSYDLVSVTPATEKLFQLCTKTLDIDIISFDFSKRLPFRLKFSQMSAATSRNIHFEVCYQAALEDSHARQNLMANVLELVRVTRGRGLILSSGARSAMDLRSPYDIANFATLLGLDIHASKAALSINCERAFHRSEARRSFRSVIRVQSIESLDPGEHWTFQSSLEPPRPPSPQRHQRTTTAAAAAAATPETETSRTPSDGQKTKRGRLRTRGARRGARGANERKNKRPVSQSGLDEERACVEDRVA